MNAVVGLVGLTVGIAIGDQFLKYGYNLGRSYKTYYSAGLIMPTIMAGLLTLLVFSPKFSADWAIFFSEKGPGSLHAPLIISLGSKDGVQRRQSSAFSRSYNFRCESFSHFRRGR